MSASSGPRALPTPRSLGAAALVEADEGHLVTATGRLDAKPTKSAAGDITLILIRDGGAPVKVMADVTSRLTLGAFKVGATYRIVGFVGQRATRTGALDGYRIWIRDAADLVLVSRPIGIERVGVPESDRERRVDPDGDRSPRLSGSPTARSPSTASSRPRRRCSTHRAAGSSSRTRRRRSSCCCRPGQPRRRSAAGSTPKAASGWPTAPRGSGPTGSMWSVRPRRRQRSCSTAAPSEANEWRLVSISGRVSSVHKLGDRWRAEIRVGSVEVVVVGQPGSGIASSALVEGRVATVTGIVRRPYPNASDRRFAITPRAPEDVTVAGQAGSGGDATGSSSEGAPGGPVRARPRPPRRRSMPMTRTSATSPRSSVGSSASAGSSSTSDADGFTLDDGTATGRVDPSGRGAR